MSDSLEPNAKVLFRVIDEEGNADVETLWATHLGADDYKLDNSPFYDLRCVMGGRRVRALRFERRVSHV